MKLGKKIIVAYKTKRLSLFREDKNPFVMCTKRSILRRRKPVLDVMREIGLK